MNHNDSKRQIVDLISKWNAGNITLGELDDALESILEKVRLEGEAEGLRIAKQALRELLGESKHE